MQVEQWRGLLSADTFGAVAMSAILLTKEEGAGLRVSFCRMEV